MQKVQGKYLIFLPIKTEIILAGNDDLKEINLTSQYNDFSCVLLNTVDSVGIQIPKQNKVYLKRAKLISSLPGLLPGISDSYLPNFAGRIYPLGRNGNAAAPNVEYFGRLNFKNFNEWYDFDAELISQNDGIENYWIPGIGDLSTIKYQDSNLNSFWIGKKGQFAVIAEIETAGVWDSYHGRLI